MNAITEPERNKTHWDFLLQEMQWLANDFKEERKWKLASAKKMGKAVVKVIEDKQRKEGRSEKDELVQLRKVAARISRDIKKYWSDIEKVVLFRHKVQVDQIKEKARNAHLDFIVGQTERYSLLLSQEIGGVTERANTGAVNEPTPLASLGPSPSPIPATKSEAGEDEEDAVVKADKDVDEGWTTDEDEVHVTKLDPMDVDVEADEKDGDDGAALAKKSSAEAEDDDETGSQHEYVPSEAGSDNENTLEEDEKHGAFKAVEDELKDLQGDAERDIHDVLAEYGVGQENADLGGVEMDDGEDSGHEALLSVKELLSTARQEREATVGPRKRLSRGKTASGDVPVVAKRRHEDEDDDEKAERAKYDNAKDEQARITLAATEASAAQPQGFTLNTAVVSVKPPFLLKGELREYQLIGLQWLVSIYDKHLNGILADEMGLGKTIMTISLLAHLACDRGVWGPHLIVVPTSVVLNWEREFLRWMPGFKVMAYHGSVKERKEKRKGWSKPNAFHVCITSYNLVVQDAAIFRRKKWKYLILDEAQNIKNFKSQRWQTLLNFNTKRRLLLTGTPLQNNLMELWSLLHFLMPHIFRSHLEFQSWFIDPMTGMVEGATEVDKALIQRLHGILRPFLLRRTKKAVASQLPSKHEHVIKCRLSRRQRFLYDEFMGRAETRCMLGSGSFLGVIGILMQLRKVCNHPDLFMERVIESPFDFAEIEYPVHSRFLLPSRKSLQSPTANLSQFILKPFDLVARENSSAVECSVLRLLNPPEPLLTEVSTRSLQSEIMYRNPFPPGSSFYLTTQEALMGLLDYRVSRAQLMVSLSRRRVEVSGMAPLYGVRLREKIREFGNNILDRIHDPSLLRKKWSTDRATPSPLLDAIMTVDRRSEVMIDVISRFVFLVPKIRSTTVRKIEYAPDHSLAVQTDRLHLEGSKMVNRVTQPFHPAKIRQEMYFPDPRLLQYDCGKLQVLADLLRRLKQGNHRCLIFTQMSRVLDILEKFLCMHGYTYCRLDGSTKVTDRQRMMEKFNSSTKIFCFILSTRSGGLGMNLTGADTVIFFDSDWNPAMDAQAQDRCHRIGQTREVHIYRLISEFTVEENILTKANQKRFLNDLVVEGGDFKVGEGALNRDDVLDIILGEQTKRLKIDAKPLEAVMSDKDTGTGPKGELDDYELAIAAVEDEDDRIGIKVVEQEQAMERGEFEFDGTEIEDPSLAAEITGAGESEYDTSAATAGAPSKAGGAEGPTDNLQQIRELESHLTPIQRYMVEFASKNSEIVPQDELNLINQQVEAELQEWDLEQLKTLKEDEEQLMSEDEDMLTFEISDTGKTSQQHYEMYREEVERMSLENLISFDIVVPSAAPTRKRNRTSSAHLGSQSHSALPPLDLEPAYPYEYDDRSQPTLDDLQDSFEPITDGATGSRERHRGVMFRRLRVPAVHFGKQWAQLVYGAVWESALVEGVITGFVEGSVSHNDRWLVTFDDDPNEYRYTWKVVKRWLVDDDEPPLDPVPTLHDGGEVWQDDYDYEGEEEAAFEAEDEEFPRHRGRSKSEGTGGGEGEGDGMDERELESSRYSNMRHQRHAALGVARATTAAMGTLVVDDDSDEEALHSRPMKKRSRVMSATNVIAATSTAPADSIATPLVPPREEEPPVPYDASDLGLGQCAHRWAEGRVSYARRWGAAAFSVRTDGLVSSFGEGMVTGPFSLNRLAKIVRIQRKFPPKPLKKPDSSEEFIWSYEEDDRINQLVTDYGVNFDLIAEILTEEVRRHRSAKLVQERFLNKLMDVPADSPDMLHKAAEDQDPTSPLSLWEIETDRLAILSVLVEKKLSKKRDQASRAGGGGGGGGGGANSTGTGSGGGQVAPDHPLSPPMLPTTPRKPSAHPVIQQLKQQPAPLTERDISTFSRMDPVAIPEYAPMGDAAAEVIVEPVKVTLPLRLGIMPTPEGPAARLMSPSDIASPSRLLPQMHPGNVNQRPPPTVSLSPNMSSPSMPMQQSMMSPQLFAQHQLRQNAVNIAAGGGGGMSSGGIQQQPTEIPSPSSQPGPSPSQSGGTPGAGMYQRIYRGPGQTQAGVNLMQQVLQKQHRPPGPFGLPGSSQMSPSQSGLMSPGQPNLMSPGPGLMSPSQVGFMTPSQANLMSQGHGPNLASPGQAIMTMSPGSQAGFMSPQSMMSLHQPQGLMSPPSLAPQSPHPQHSLPHHLMQQQSSQYSPHQHPVSLQSPQQSLMQSAGLMSPHSNFPNLPPGSRPGLIPNSSQMGLPRTSSLGQGYPTSSTPGTPIPQGHLGGMPHMLSRPSVADSLVSKLPGQPQGSPMGGMNQACGMGMGGLPGVNPAQLARKPFPIHQLLNQQPQSTSQISPQQSHPMFPSNFSPSLAPFPSDMMGSPQPSPLPSALQPFMQQSPISSPSNTMPSAVMGKVGPATMTSAPPPCNNSTNNTPSATPKGGTGSRNSPKVTGISVTTSSPKMQPSNQSPKARQATATRAPSPLSTTSSTASEPDLMMMTPASPARRARRPLSREESEAPHRTRRTTRK